MTPPGRSHTSREVERDRLVADIVVYWMARSLLAWAFGEDDDE